MKKPDPIPNASRWQNRLPSTYETLISGFHAGLTVDDMATHLKMDVVVPDKIKKIKIGAFTPDMFKDESCAEFWQSPVSKRNMSKEVYNALNDPDIATVQLAADYIVDPDNATLETLARVAQAQYVGFQVRMGELTSQNFFNRLEQLRDPVFYEKLRNSPYVKKNNLQDSLPKEIPYFEATKREFSVKGVTSAIGKAYDRTGKPKSADDFFASPNKYGVFAVPDLQRTSLKLSKSGKIDRDTLKDDYTNVRNVVAIALMSGELGIAIDNSDHCEVSDQVLYPSSDRPSDLYPVFKANGRIYHAGPKGSHLSAPLEIQIPVLEDYLIEDTHKAYDLYRSISDKTEEGRKLRGQQNEIRVGLFNSGLPDDIKLIREKFLETKKVADNDAFAFFMNKSDVFGNSQPTCKRAIEVAYEEFPEREEEWQKKITEFDPFQPTHSSGVLSAALRDIIQRSEEAPVISMAKTTRHSGVMKYNHSS